MQIWEKLGESWLPYFARIRWIHTPNNRFDMFIDMKLKGEVINGVVPAPTKCYKQSDPAFSRAFHRLSSFADFSRSI